VGNVIKKFEKYKTERERDKCINR